MRTEKKPLRYLDHGDLHMFPDTSFTPEAIELIKDAGIGGSGAPGLIDDPTVVAEDYCHGSKTSCILPPAFR